MHGLRSAALILLCGCSSEPLCRSSQAVVGGGALESYLALSVEQQRAVAHLSATLPQGRAHCSGVLIAPGAVLTAQHCAPLFERDDLRIDLGGSAVQVRERADNPELDLMLVRIADDAGAVPIPLGDEPAAELLGLRVELAGFGRTESLQPGALRFAVVPVVSVDEQFVVVEGDGRSGPCDGDSGGPLLLRGPDGDVRVGGVLSNGSVTCKGKGNYVRVDTALAWLAEHGVAPSRGDCGSLGADGRCYGARVAWCERGEPRGEICQACGWDPKLARYGCGASSGCGSDLGSCDGSVVTRCERGQVRSVDCASRGADCYISATTGAATCSDDSAEPACL